MTNIQKNGSLAQVIPGELTRQIKDMHPFMSGLRSVRNLDVPPPAIGGATHPQAHTRPRSGYD